MNRVTHILAASTAGLLVVPIVGVFTPPPAAQAKQTVINGEVLRQDTRWSVAGGPYVIRRAVQIPHGITLTVEPGVRIVGENTEFLFRVGGNLSIQGSVKSPVTIEAGRQGSIIEHATTHDRPGSVSISYARISNTRSIMPPGGNGMYIQFVLADSTVRDVRSSSHVWYPLAGSAIMRNTFASSGGFSIGMDARGPNGEPQGSPIRVEGNRFLTRSTTKYWIENWAAYGSALPVHGNSFLAAGAPSVALPAGYDNSSIDASGNYWGTVNAKVIDRMVLDARDDIRRAGVIDIEPILAAAPKGPPATTPSSPYDVTASSGESGTVQVSWTRPSDPGGRTPLTYSVTADPGPGSCEVTGAVTCSISGLPSGTHTFTAVASNPAGTSPASTPSAAITVGGSGPEPPPSGTLATVTLGAISMQTQGRWVASDGCGNYVFSFSGVGSDDIGTFRLVDVVSGKILDSDLTLGARAAGTSTFTVCEYQLSADTRLALELDFSGLGTARSATFSWEVNPPPLPSPGSVPANVTLGPIVLTTSGAWPSPPASGCANYLFTYSGITRDDIGSVRLIDATQRTVLDSEVFLGTVGNGTETFSVCSFQANAKTRLILQADFSRLGVAESRNFEWQRSTPPTPSTEALPALAIAGVSAVATTGDWSVPRSCRNFTYTFYGMAPDAIASVRVINAVTRKVLGSDVLIDPPSNGTGTVFMCPSDASSSTVAVLQFDLASYGVVESEAFRFT
jgi:hypothetical protein